MCTLDEIESLLNATELPLRIVRSLGSSTVALFAFFDDHGEERLELAGTGTLVFNDNGYYILTAAHVWEEVLKRAVKLGITRIDNRDHRYPIEIAEIVPNTLKPERSNWGEWGPDLAMLRIPPERARTIEASQVFEDLNRPTKFLGLDCVECWFVMGTPKELGKFEEDRALVQIIGAVVYPQHYRRGEYDFLDCPLDVTSPGRPKNFGGVSGGGLWRVVVYCSPETGEIDCCVLPARS